MRSKWIKRLFPIFALLILAPWPVAYAHNYNGVLAGENGVQIGVAEASDQPTWTTSGEAIGGVTPGDLFYVDATGNPADITVVLYITNASELIDFYQYLILEVGILTGSDTGEWERALMGSGEPVPDTFITMRSGQVRFTLPGLARYKIAINGGSFYCPATGNSGGSLSPQFYLEVN
jgi:hypothetical protein